MTLLLYHDPTPQMFERHVEVLRRHYTAVPFGDLLRALDGRPGTRLPPSPIVITLDGHRSNVQLTSVIERLEVPVTIFLCNGIVGTRRRSWIDFRFHTISHPIPRKARQENRGSRLELDREYGIRIPALSFPRGDYSDRVIRLAREAGYASAPTVDAGFNFKRTNPFRPGGCASTKTTARMSCSSRRPACGA